MNILFLTTSVFVLLFSSGSCNEVRKKRNILTLLDLIDDFCDGEEICISDVTDDLIYYVSKDPYDPKDRDSGASRMTVLLESLDDKCNGDEDCLEDLFQDLRKRVIDSSDDDSDDDYMFGSQADEEESDDDDWFDEDDEDYFDEDADDDDDNDLWNDDDEDDDGWGDSNDSGFESDFERFELNENLDETVINEMNKDECMQNREACQKFVEKEEKLGLNHIGEIQYDADGQPVAFVPKSMVFKEELRIPEGADDPEGL